MSDWGRESTKQEAPRRRRGGFGSFLFALIVGIVGGFALYHYLATGTLPDRDFLEELPSGITSASQDTLQLRAQRDRLQQRVEELRSGQTSADADLQEELADLRDSQIPQLLEGLTEREQKVRELEAKLQLAEQVTQDLQNQLEAVPGDAGDGEDLRAQLAQRDQLLGQMDSEITRLSKFESELEETRSELEAALENARERDGAAAATAELRGRVAEQTTQISELQAALENALKRDDATAATAELGDRIAEQKTQISGLETQLSTARRNLSQRDDLLKKLDQEVSRLSDVETELSLARTRLASVEDAQRDAATDSDAATTRLAAKENQIAKLEQSVTDLGQKLQERDKALREMEEGSTAIMDALKEELSAERNEADEAVDALSAANKQISELQSEISDLETSPREPDQGSTAIIASLNEELAAARREANAATDALSEAKSQISDLQTEIASLETKAPETATAQETPSNRSDSADPDTSADQTERAPRDPLLVATAMQQADGLSSLQNSQRDRIATRLIEGDCVADVLSDEFGRVPKVALRDLIGTLDSDC